MVYAEDNEYLPEEGQDTIGEPGNQVVGSLMGPISRMVSGTITTVQQTGISRGLIVSGSLLSSHFSNMDSRPIMMIGGITVAV